MGIYIASWLIVLLALVPVTSALSSNNVPKERIERVGIIGAGITGLSLAHALENSKEDLEVSIFDSRKSLDFTVGSGVQLSGGLNVLGKINPDVQKAVIEAAIPVSNIRGKNKSWFSDTDTSTLWDYSIEKIIRDAGGAAEEELIQDGKVMWYGIMRGALQEVLFQALPKNNNKLQVEFGKTLVGIESEDSGAFCTFADGSKAGPYDLIVGADGVKSAVKEYVDRGKISKDASKREGSAAAIYSGIRIGYAVEDGKSIEERKKKVALEQTFADGAYILAGTYGNGPNRPPCNCAFIISLDENFNGPFKRKMTPDNSETAENSDWSQDNKMTTDDVRKEMLHRMKATGVASVDIVQAVTDADRFFDLGVYFHNPISLSGWSKEIPASGGSLAVLCGDAAHTMPPFLGQGANQGIQDALCLSQKIELYNSKIMTGENLELKSLFKEYESTRWKPTAIITAKAAILGYLETGGRNGFFSKFRDIFFKTLALLGVPVKVLLDSALPKID